MISQTEVTNGIVRVNGADIYYERRGSGPSLLFIQGATGDGGTFERTAELLSDQFTVVTYDRRGNSRSSAPENWRTTSIQEQADDAAALIHTLNIGPAAVFGTSGGALILLQLVASHPEVLRGAIVHEPAIIANMPGGREMVKGLRSFLEESLAGGGPRDLLERFLPMVAGEATFRNLDVGLRQRMLGNADVLVNIEMESFASFQVDINKLLSVEIPVILTAGRDNASTSNMMLKSEYEAASWLASVLGSQLHELSGAHTPYLDRPERFVRELRPLLKGIG